MKNKEKDFSPIELDDDQLEDISGGYEVGSVVSISSPTIRYCPGCGRLIRNLPVTITGVRGVLDGKTIYWITHSCCGHKTSEIETVIN